MPVSRRWIRLADQVASAGHSHSNPVMDVVSPVTVWLVGTGPAAGTGLVMGLAVGAGLGLETVAARCHRVLAGQTG